MPYLTRSALKKQKMALNSPATRTFNINTYLNNDCLISIFEYLSIDDKLMIESVCKRWENIGKLSWSKVKSFQFGKNIMRRNKWSAKISTIIKVIKRCGPYLTQVHFDGILDVRINYDVIFRELSNNCQNITNLIINHFHDFKGNNLGQLFKNNPQISKITISVKILKNAENLFFLNAHLMTELHLIGLLELETEHSLYEFFSKLINLKLVSIKSSSIDSKKLIAALNKSNCENIHDFFFLSTYVCKTELSMLLSKQKNLFALSLDQDNLDKKFWNSLRECPLEKVHIHVNEETASCLTKFKNLTKLICFIPDFIDDLTKILIMKNLAKCISLKRINFYCTGFFYTKEFIDCLADFRNLESLKFKGLFININPIVNGLAIKCQNLKKLKIKHCDIGSLGLKNLCLLKNLIVLRLSIPEESKFLIRLINVIKSLPRLEKLGICCDQPSDKLLTYEFFEEINDIKVERNDKNILKIYIEEFAWADIYHYYNMTDEFPLICIFNGNL